MSQLLNANQPIIFGDGTMAQQFRDLIIQLQDQLPLTGTGSPEGVVEAPQFSLYLDTDGTTGTIQYRKMLTSITNDTKKGWVLL